MSAVVTKLDAKFEKKIQKMEALLLHSVCGVHALFRNHEIKQAFQTPLFGLPRTPDLQKKVEALIANLIEQPSLHEKISYLNALDPESHSLIVQTYMEILEGALRNLHPQIH